MVSEEAIRNPKLTRYLPKEQAKSAYYHGGKIDYGKSDDKNAAAWLVIEKELMANFGTEAGFKRMIAEDPVHVMATLAELMIPAATLAKMPKLAAFAAKIDPLDLTAAIAKAAKNKILSKNISTGLFRRSLKLGDNLSFERKERLLEIAKQNKLNIDMKQYDKLDTQIKQIEATKIAVFTALGRESVGGFPIDRMFKDLDEFQTDVLKISPLGSDIFKPIKDFKKRIIEANEYLGRKDLSLIEINAYKKEFGRHLDKFFDQIVSTTGDMPINQEMLARVTKTLRQTIETVVPELDILQFPKLSRKIMRKRFGKKFKIEDVMQLQGDLIELRGVIYQQANDFSVGKMMDFQVGQKTATGAFVGSMIGTALGGEAGQLTGLYIGGAIGLGLGALDSSPRLKMQVGNVLNTMKGMGITVNPTAALIRLGLYEAGDYAKQVYPDLGD
jgi:hypothetical protein